MTRVAVPYGSSWKYLPGPSLLIPVDTALLQPGYDDSAWAVMPSPFGRQTPNSIGIVTAPDPDWSPIATFADFGTTVYLRRQLTVEEDPEQLLFRVDGDVQVYVNGVYQGIYSVGGGITPAIIFAGGFGLPPDSRGCLIGLYLSQHVRGGTDGYYHDIALEVAGRVPVRQWPRDDGLGMASAPRLFPPTKANRITGGYQ